MTSVSISNPIAIVGRGPRVEIYNVLAYPDDPPRLGRSPVLPDMVRSVAYTVGYDPYIYVATVGSLTAARHVVVRGSYAYVANNQYGLAIVDISNPLAPFVVGSYVTPGYSQRVALDDRWAFIADTSSVVVLDISNPAQPALAGQHPAFLANDVAVSGAYVYVADGLNGLLVLEDATQNLYLPLVTR